MTPSTSGAASSGRPTPTACAAGGPARVAAVPFSVFPDLPAFPASPPPAHRSPAPARDEHPIHRLERGRRTAHRRLTMGTGSHFRGQHVQPPPTAKQPDNAVGTPRL